MGNKAVKFKDNSGNAVYPCPYYPVGSIYMSVNNVNPTEFFGGTWEQIKDRFLLACGSSHTNGSIGGNSSVTLQNNNLPGRTMVRIEVENKYGCGCNSNINGWGNICLDDAQLPSNQSFGIMPPYLAVYVWKRTA